MTGWTTITMPTWRPHCLSMSARTTTGQNCHVRRWHLENTIYSYNGMVSYRWPLSSVPATHSSLRGGGWLHQCQPCARALCYDTHAVVLSCHAPLPPPGLPCLERLHSHPRASKGDVGDFWRMVLERGSRCIVMLCRLMEGERVGPPHCTTALPGVPLHEPLPVTLPSGGLPLGLAALWRWPSSTTRPGLVPAAPLLPLLPLRAPGGGHQGPADHGQQDHHCHVQVSALISSTSSRGSLSLGQGWWTVW